MVKLVILSVVVLVSGCCTTPTDAQRLCKETQIKKYKFKKESVQFEIECYKNEKF